jgi:glycosyltransferase involved in cell wall biosynthesis
MRVLMLGWEFPPFITGGLGTACYGLTKALERCGVDVTFVLPKSVDAEHAAHVNVLSPGGESEGGVLYVPRGGGTKTVSTEEKPAGARRGAEPEGAGTRAALRTPGTPELLPLDMSDSGAYARPEDEGRPGDWIDVTQPETGIRRIVRRTPDGDEVVVYETADGMTVPPPPPPQAPEGYGGDLMAQVERYAHFCLHASQHVEFDVIHAHDWMTYPAGLWIARLSGKPLVVHVHSTEFDRSGEHVNQRVYDVERRGMHGAIKVICVSQLTKNIVQHRYAVPEEHIEVVYNGVEFDDGQIDPPRIRSKDKIVLYFGRITFQKGPEYFLRAAKRVLEYTDDVKFVVAGSGDMAQHMIEMAAKMGIGHKVLFTGFLRGKDIKRVFALADLYVMPSVSEPFGIAPLEAMSNDVPVIISKSSGVSEVLSHALKVDFWDTEDMANKIIAVLRHPPLSQTLRQHGAFEARRITWEGAASRCRQIYGDVQRFMRGATPVAHA